MKLSLSFSSLNKYETCPRQYALHYVEGWRSAITPANLVFGRAIHEVLTEYVIRHARGEQGHFDPVSEFRDRWDEATGQEELEYSVGSSPDKLRATGEALTGQFPGFWDQSGLTALIGADGSPLVEKKLSTAIAPGIKLRGYPDVVALTADGEVAVIDLKTAKTAAPESTLKIGEQLTDYQALVDANRDRLGIESVHRLGFVELLKRNVPNGNKGKGPEIVGPTLTQARTEAELSQRREKVSHLADQIAKGVFFKKPGMAFNSPCSMCDFRDLCLHGSEEGLIRPQTSQARIA